MSQANPQIAEVIELATSELTYLPTPDQRRAKSAFWARFEENPICDASNISLALAMRLAGDARLQKWWPLEGFKDWFRNKDEFRQRIENTAHMALDRLETILIDPRSPPSAAVAAAKLIMEIARKMPTKQEMQKFMDEHISTMDKAQLERFIQERSLHINKPLTSLLEEAIVVAGLPE